MYNNENRRVCAFCHMPPMGWMEGKTMTEQEKMIQEMIRRMKQEQDRKLNNFRAQNLYIQKGKTLFTGSSLMEMFPITEFCLNEGFPIAYNRGIGGYTTDDFLAAADAVLLDPAPQKLFINIGTNDIHARQDGEDWFDHLERNYRKICGIIKEKLPETTVYMMAYYPVNADAPGAKNNSGMRVRTNENINKANRMVEALAREFGFHYIDVNDGLKDAEGKLKIEHTADGIHFDSAAYRTVFERLKKYL